MAADTPGSGLPGTRGGPRVVPFGEAAWLAMLGQDVDARLNRRVHGLADRIRAARPDQPGWGEPVPGYASVLAPYDPARIDPDRARAELTAWVVQAVAGDPQADPDLPVVDVPVRYGGADGPDLSEVADRLGLGEAEVVDLHATPVYRVFLLGFVPGFAYLGPLPDALFLPRRSEPRERVPSGSVAIAARQTAVYPFATPGGWHLIGRTGALLWDPRRDPPAVLRPGGRVRFVPERT